jgi:two-component system response regulator DesR
MPRFGARRYCAATHRGKVTDMPGSDVFAETLKVFLADDSALIRARVAAMLGACAMTVVGQAETPQGCIEGILATRPDVVVLDVQLEGGAGLDVLRAVRRADPRIAFVVFSNNSAAAYRKRYLEGGAVSFLDKHSEFDRLPRAVSHASQFAFR